MSNENDPTDLIRQMQYAQNFVSRIVFSDKYQVIEVLKKSNAFEKPEGSIRLEMH